MVSLVMTAWRPRRDWLFAAVWSALDERECAVELIVVDDGSPEPVADLLAEIEDERLRVVRVPHGGPYRARNAGLEAARGEYVRYVDSDDVFDPGSTSRLLRLADGDGDGVISYGATAFCDETLTPRSIESSDLAGNVVLDCLLDRFPIMPPSLLFPRSVIEATGEWDPEFRVSGDWDYALRAFEHAPVRGHGTVATYYRQRPGSVSKHIGDGMDGARRVVERYFDRHPEQRGSVLERQTEGMLAARDARGYAAEGRILRSLRSSRRALSLDPGMRREGRRRALPAVSRACVRQAGRRLLRRGR